MDLRHCTITRNTAGDSGGGLVMNPPAIVRVERSIIAGNSAPFRADIANYNASLIAIGPSLIGSNESAEAEFPSSPLAGTATAPRDPLLAPLDHYGGPTRTVALMPGSPARNAATGSRITSDQRLFPLVGTPDLGAYEAGTITSYENFIWETLPATATVAQHDDAADFDADGATNHDEWNAGTVVTNPASVFRITSTTRNGNDIIVTFPTVSDRTYSFLGSSDMVTWELIPEFRIGDGQPLTVTLPGAGGYSRRFVRVVVSP